MTNSNSNLPSSRIKDLRGQRFNRLVVRTFEGFNKRYQALWLCLCDCGNEKLAITSQLIKGVIQSCGCYKRDRLRNGIRQRRDLTGQRFGRLFVESFSHIHKTPTHQFTVWNVICDCGTRKTVAGKTMTAGHATSCSCYGKEQRRKANTTHGMSSDHRTGQRNYLYDLWRDIRDKVNNPKSNSYHLYGGRGIAYDPRWDDFTIFVDDIVTSIGHRPSKMYSLDRKNNDGNYEISNVWWRTYAEQNRNKRTNHNITINGETMCLTDWATRCGQTPERVSVRINRLGWTPEEALGLVQRARKTRPLKVEP